MRAIALAIVSVLIVGQAWAEENVIEMLKKTPASMWDVGEVRLSMLLNEEKREWKIWGINTTYIRPSLSEENGLSFRVLASTNRMPPNEACEIIFQNLRTMLGNYGIPTNDRTMDYATVGWMFSSAPASRQDAERLGERLMKDAYIDVNIIGKKQNKTCREKIDTPYTRR